MRCFKLAEPPPVSNNHLDLIVSYNKNWHKQYNQISFSSTVVFDCPQLICKQVDCINGLGKLISSDLVCVCECYIVYVSRTKVNQTRIECNAL